MSAEINRAAPAAAPLMPGWLRQLLKQDVLLILIGFVIIASLISPAFLTPTNLTNLLSQSALLGILATAQFLVVVCGGFDLSVAAVMALSSLVFASNVGIGVGPAAVMALATGGACGLFNGLVITKGRVQPLIATLAMMGIARGLALSISEKSILVRDPVVAAIRSFSWLVSVPTMVWFAVVLVGIVWFATSRQALHVYAVGGNEQTARLAGVRVDRIKIGVYTASGLLSGLAGLALVMRASSGSPLGGMGWELDTIAAIVIGGTNLFGGEGKLLRAMMGVLIYQMIANIMNLTRIDPFYQDIVRACVIVAAGALGVLRQRRTERRILQRRPA
jgi:ribose/xylose/arabinose/galactoside ABC-type transport system permease subunit